MSKEKLNAAEWALVKDAPYWVHAALVAADKRATKNVSQREEQAMVNTLKGYRSSNPLIRDIMAAQGKPAAEIEKASKNDADVALGRIASIVESKLGGDDLDALNDLLLQVGQNVAEAAKESAIGLGDEVSKKEAAALKELEVVLRATDDQKRARREKANAAMVAAAAEARKEAAAKAEREKREAEAKQAEAAKAKAKQEQTAAEARDRQEKARAEAEAKKKEEQAASLAKAREEAEARQREALAQREAKAKEEQARAEAEAKAAEEQARAEAEAKSAAEREAAAKQSAPRFTEFIAEHTVVAGENLSFISQKYYGHQGNFRLIYEANRDVIGDNMNLIRPGQKLRIPKL